MAGSRRTRQPVPPTQLGMLLGIVAGAAAGVVMFAITMDALWLTLPGVGVALGLGVGAAVEKRRGEVGRPGRGDPHDRARPPS